MNAYTEDNLVQKTTAEYLVNSLDWNENAYALQEVIGSDVADGAAPSRIAASADDVRLTERLVEASRIIGIQILDHLILGVPSNEDGRGFVSLRKTGMIGGWV